MKTESCWWWTSAVGSSLGYGVFWIGGGKSKYAHRVSWELSNGRAVPDGMCVLHECDNPLCVNPSHLRLGTHQDNNEDKRLKRRHAYGERNPGGGKLNWQKSREIRASSLGCTRLGRLYGVSGQTIKSIRRNRIWKLELDPIAIQ